MILILWEDGFPTVDGVAVTREALAALPGARFAGVADFPAALAEGPDAVIFPYGAAFPEEIWQAFFAYLQAGGRWLNLGGAPLTRPAHRDGDTWVVEPPQTRFSKRLRINHAYPIDLPAGTRFAYLYPALHGMDWLEDDWHPHRAWSLQLRFAEEKVFPEECGSQSYHQAEITQKMIARYRQDDIAAPLVLIDRLRAPFTGGRWLLVTAECSEPLSAPYLQEWVDMLCRPHVRLGVHTSFACYYPGESAVISVTVSSDVPRELEIPLQVTNGWHTQVVPPVITEVALTVAAGATPCTVKLPPLPLTDAECYHLQVTASDQGTLLATAENGFWVYDRDFMASGPALTVDRDYFHRDGVPYPVTGTTYMGPTQRFFLAAPTPAAWMDDFAAMKAAGINAVRTGLWMGWVRAMPEPGTFDEGVLRAFAAFLLTARHFEMPVIFTFFAFLPHTWGGVHAYCDPDAVAAQQAFLAAFTQRFSEARHVLWDFINEPSFASPDHLWFVRPNYDRAEQAAWARWLRAQAPDDAWRRRWRLTPDEPLALPPLEEFTNADVFDGLRPLRVLDYRRFGQETFARWAAEMAAVVRANGNPHQLCTVGQDEAGAEDSPNPWWWGPAVDFTSNHSWWKNDALLWDSVVTKTPDRPNLLEETGIMFLENVDGGSRRTPDDSRRLLARKLALSFAGGCAGFIQWLWHTNVYNDSDIEAGIGLHRADGVAKPELDAVRGVAAFVATHAGRFTGRVPEDVCLVLPHSNMFSVRNTATEATRRVVRVLEYRLGVPVRAISEHRAAEIGDAQTIILPSPRVLTDACWTALLEKVAAGATLVASGFFEADPYWRPAPRMAPLIGPLAPAAVAREEDGATFPGPLVQQIDKAVAADGTPLAPRVIAHGRGRIVWHPLPLELAEEAQTEAWYRTVFPDAAHGHPGVLVRPVRFAESTLFLLLSEAGTPQTIDRFGVTLAPGGMAMVFVETATGAVVGCYVDGEDTARCGSA
jgi:hypothetical protein